MPFIPNAADAFHESMASPDSGHFETLRAGSKATGVVSGAAVAAQGTPDMTVAVASGVIAWEGTPANVTAGNLTLTADGTDPRFYLIVASSAGVKSAVAGTPAPEMDPPTEPGPVFPAIPATSVVLASVYVPAADTDIDANQIDDMRVFVVLPEPTTNYDLSKAQSIPLVKERSQLVTLDSGENLPHAIALAGDKLFVGFLTTPGILVRFNNLDDLTDRTDLTFPADGFHDNIPAMTYVRETDRLYVLFCHASRTTVAEVNLSTMAWTDVISNTTDPSGPANGGSICSDGTNLYVATLTSPTKVLKYRISDFTLQGTATLTGFNLGHASLYDGTDVFVTGASSPAWVVRVTTSDMTHTGAATPDNTLTDDFCSAGDYLWVGHENTPTGYLVYRIEKATLANQTPIWLGSSGLIYTLYFDGRYVWIGTTGGELLRVDPVTLQVGYIDYPDLNLNEIVSDGAGRLFFTHFLSPAKVGRVFAPPLTFRGPASTVRTGQGTLSGKVIGVSFVDSALKNAGSSEVNLTSTSLTGGTFGTNKQAFRLTASGRFAANANTKRVKVRVGTATDTFDTGLLAFNGTQWHLEFIIVRTGTDTQDWVAKWVSDDSVLATDVQHGTATLDDAVSNAIATRAIGGAADDVQQEFYLLESINA